MEIHNQSREHPLQNYSRNIANPASDEHYHFSFFLYLQQV